MSNSAGPQRLFAFAMMTIGGLMTILCGLCTVFYLGAAIWSLVLPAVHHGTLTPSERYSAAWAPIIGIGSIIIGGLPTGIGAALFISGLRAVRKVKK